MTERAQGRGTSGRRARRRRRTIAGGAFALAILVGGAWLARAGDGLLPPGVSVAGVDLGGRSDSEARALLERRALELRRRSIGLSADGVPGFRRDVPAAAVAGRPLVDRALREAHEARGPGGRLLARLHLSGDRAVPLRFAVRADGVAELVSLLRGRLDRAPVPARVRVTADGLSVVPSRTGRRVDQGKLREALQTLPAHLTVPLRRAEPAVGDGEAEAARGTAQRIAGSPREVRLGRRSAVLAPAALRRALRFPVRDGALEVVLDAGMLRDALAAPLGARQASARDARFEVQGDEVTIVPSVPGRLLDTQALAAAIVANPQNLVHETSVRAVEPDLTTAEARAMGIRERISSFTTPYGCCPPRVTNIRQAAQIIDGTIIPAGGRFSLNEVLGPRTAERGFVEAPQIEDGRLVDAVGGGVSQVATTMYNAAFFAGLDLVAHTPHQFYISRYPMGREATVSWGGPELVFRNDWDAAILVTVVAADDGITVRFFSSMLERRVETETGTPRPGRAAKTVEVKKSSLPPGTRNVVQEKGAGSFSVAYTRRVYQGERLRRDERFAWTYSAEDGIVEVGPPKPGGDGGRSNDPGRPDGVEPASPRSTPPPAPTPPPSPSSPLPGGSGGSPSAPPLPGSGG